MKALLRGTLLAAALAGGAGAHVAGGGAGGGTRGPGRLGTGTAVLETNDSLKASADVFVYLSDSRASGQRSGDPLGAGGKIPLSYNMLLFQESPADRPSLARDDWRPQYQDFSYIPLWQPPQLGARLRYRFLPRLWGTLALDYNGEPSVVNARDAARTPEITEMTLKWGPESVPGLSLTMGELRLTGAYAPLFDHFMLENFRFSGVMAEYRKETAAAGSWRARIAAGKEWLGRTLRSDLSVWRDVDYQFVFLDAVRERHHLNASLRWTAPGGFFLGGLAGYQVVPEDSSVSAPAPESFRRWPRADGWLAGLEAGYRAGAWDHQLVLSHGAGDAQMAWSGPDAVHDPSLDSLNLRFTRQGSALSQAAYWTGFRGPLWRLETGAWGQMRMPSRREAAFRFVNNSPDTLRIRSSRMFRAAKFALQASRKVAGPLRLGARGDALLYLDPRAHANVFEALTDEAMRPVVDPSDGDRLEGPARWEREAVNTGVLSPFAELDWGEGFHVRASWSGAWYANPVRRQGRVSDFHGNAVLAAWLTYRFARLDGF